MTSKLSLAECALVASLRRQFNAGNDAIDVCCLDCTFVWSELVDLAVKHQVAPLLYSSLSASDGCIPDDIRDRLRITYLAERMLLEVDSAPAVRQVVDALHSAGIAPVLLKGAALAYSVYPEPVHRSFSDIDLLLPRNQLEPAREILVRSGFYSKGETEASHHLQPMYGPDSDFGVELHVGIISDPHPYLLDMDPLLDRCQMAEVAGSQVRTLSPADALFLACLHMSYAHRYRRLPLRHLTDILAISSGRANEIDWHLLVQTTRQSRAAGAVFWPLLLARSLLEAPIPEAVLRRLSPSTALRRVVHASTSPEYILTDHRSRIADPLHRLLRLAALFDGCPGRELALAVRDGARDALSLSRLTR